MTKGTFDHAGFGGIIRRKFQRLCDNLGFILRVVTAIVNKLIQKRGDKRVAGTHSVYDRLQPVGRLMVETVAVIANGAFAAAGADADFGRRAYVL